MRAEIFKKLYSKFIKYFSMKNIDLYDEEYDFFRIVTGEAMRVHSKYRSGLLESAYEAALKYLLESKGFEVERQVYLPIYWDEIKLDQTYRMDLVINKNIIVELKSVSNIDTQHRRQLFNYMNLTHMPYGMLLNFGAESLYSEWYYFDDKTRTIDRVRLKKTSTE